MNHNIPISATFTLFKYLQVNPSVNYTERWYTRKVNQQYNEETHRLEALPGDTINGFYRVSNYSASLSLSTKLYGMYKPLFMKKKEIQIRHVFTPQVSLSGAPGFSKYWEEYTDYNGDTQYYSPFTGQPYGVPSREGSGTVSFSIANNLEMKYYDAKEDTVKKVSLIDDLSANMSYNMAAKERPWSDLSINLRLKLTKSYTFNMNASFATYAYTFDKSGNVVTGNRTEWSYGRFGRFQDMVLHLTILSIMILGRSGSDRKRMKIRIRRSRKVMMKIRKARRKTELSLRRSRMRKRTRTVIRYSKCLGL